MTDSAKDVYQRGGFGGEIALAFPVALLVVDFCNAFVDPDMLGGGNIALAAEKTRALLGQARLRGWPVAHSRIAYKQDGSDANIWQEKVPRLKHLVEGSEAVEFVPSLRPIAGEHVVRKTVPSAFFGSQLESWLKERGAKGLAIAGCTTSGCVRASVVDALSFGFRTVVISDCVGDRALDAHDASLTDIAAKYAAVMSADKFLEATGQFA